MIVNCPECRHTISMESLRIDGDSQAKPSAGDTRNDNVDATPPVVDDRSFASPARGLSGTACPNCGYRFSLFDEETITFRGGKTETIRHFEIVEYLGSGASGNVFKARDTKLDRLVAIKIPRKGELSVEEADYFVREARAAAQLTHPGIVRVHEVGEDGNRLFIVSDFVDGVTLADRLSDRPYSARQATELLRKIAVALEHAHEHGVIHRDLKPSNIMIDADGSPHVMDFGLAKRQAGEVTMTVQGKVLGTPAYMSPEQARGEAHHADARSDVYSAGVILFEMLTGERPFRGNTRMLIYHVLHDEAPSPRKLNNTIPRDLETICLKCLEKDPDKRYQSARELADELQRFLNGEPIHARPVSRLARTWRWSKRNRTATALIGSIMLLLLTISIAGPLIVAEKAARREERAEHDRHAEKQKLDTARQRNRAQAEIASLMTAAKTALQNDRPEQAMASYSQAVGIGKSFAEHVETQSLSEQAARRQRLLSRFIEFERLTAPDAKTYSAQWPKHYHTEELKAARSGKQQQPHVPRELAEVKAALELFGSLQDRHWPIGMQDLPVSSSQKGRFYRVVVRYAWLSTQSALANPQPATLRRQLAFVARAEAVTGAQRIYWRLRQRIHTALRDEESAKSAQNNYRRSRRTGALDHYANGLALYSQGTDAATAKEQTTYFRLAIMSFRRALNEAHDYDSLFQVYRCYHKLKDTPGQLASLSSLISLRRNDAVLYYLRGMVRFEMAQRDRFNYLEALHDFDNCIRADPRFPHGHFYRARMYVVLGRWDVAEQSLTETLKVDAEYSSAWHWRAIARSKLNRHAEAAADAEVAVKRDPKDRMVHYYAARAYAQSVRAAQELKDIPLRDALVKRYRDRSIELIQRAVNLGFTDFSRLGKGGDFDPVRDDPRFRKLFAGKLNSL